MSQSQCMTLWGIARFLPLPRAGEGRGKGVFGRACVVCVSLTLVLSQRERELFFPTEVPRAGNKEN